MPPHESIGPHNRQELAPVDKRQEESERDSRGVVRAARSDLALDITGKLFSEKRFSAASCARDWNISRSRRNESVRRANTVLSTSAGS
jgi:hypothetical protein